MKGGLPRRPTVVAIGTTAALAGHGAAHATTSTATGWCGLHGHVGCHPRDAGLSGVVEDTVTGIAGYRFGYRRPHHPGFS